MRARVQTLVFTIMIKRIVQYFRKRNDMRLRKWCVKLAAKIDCIHYTDMSDAANRIYEWVKGLPESKP